MGGPYGVGKRIDLPSTRRIINAILNGTLEDVQFVKLPVFNLDIPVEIKGVNPSLPDPRSAWSSADEWQEAAIALGEKFIKNFNKFTSNKETAALISAGPQV